MGAIQGQGGRRCSKKDGCGCFTCLFSFHVTTEEVEELSGRLKASRQRVGDLEKSFTSASTSSHKHEQVRMRGTHSPPIGRVPFARAANRFAMWPSPMREFSGGQLHT